MDEEKLMKIIEKEKDVKVPLSKLHEYFNTTEEQCVEMWDKPTHKKYTNFYINPSIPFDVQIQDTMVSFYEQDIYEIRVVEYLDDVPKNDYRTTLFFYDENVKWLEDIDINTNVSDDEIIFIFSHENLELCATNNNDERQAYIELDEKINIWADNSENRKIMREWFSKYKEILELKKK